MVRGWRMIFFSIGLVALAFALNRYAEPVAYRVFPPSPTVTQTPTVTMTPTISMTPTITLTPTITETPSVTNTPAMPPEVQAEFAATAQPNPNSVFSDLVFSREIEDNLPVEPAIEFANPITSLYGTFSYDQMVSGSQWSALWYRGTDLLCYETMPWDGSTGGYGYTECEITPDQWLPGEYEVQVFVGAEWKSSGRFTVTGEPPTAAPTLTPSRTPSPTFTIGPSPTRTNTLTLTPSITPLPTWTLPPTLTPTQTRTPRPTDTRLPTLTRIPSVTPIPTRTPRPPTPTQPY